MQLGVRGTRLSRNSGVTLVELLVGLTVGAIVIIGVLFSWGLAVRNNAYVLGVTALNNDMRSLMAIVTQDLRRASQDPGRVWRTAEGRTVVIDGSCVAFNPFFTRADDQVALPVTVPSGYRLVNGVFQFWLGADPPILNDLDVRCASNGWETILESGDRGIQLNDFAVNDTGSVCLQIDSELSWDESGTTYGPCPEGVTERLELTLLEVTLSGTVELAGVARDFEFTDVVQLRNYRVLED
jgi:type II secretory pathway pseudopilin PulG